MIFDSLENMSKAVSVEQDRLYIQLAIWKQGE